MGVVVGYLCAGNTTSDAGVMLNGEFDKVIMDVEKWKIFHCKCRHVLQRNIGILRRRQFLSMKCVIHVYMYNIR